MQHTSICLNYMFSYIVMCICVGLSQKLSADRQLIHAGSYLFEGACLNFLSSLMFLSKMDRKESVRC